MCVGESTRVHISGSTETLAPHGKNSRLWKSSDLRCQGCNVRVVEGTCKKTTWPGTKEQRVRGVWQAPNGGEMPFKVKVKDDDDDDNNNNNDNDYFNA